jgi:hypothetical protein
LRFAGTTNLQASHVTVFTSLTAGSNTFTAKYRVTANTGTWQDRRMFVLGL